MPEPDPNENPGGPNTGRSAASEEKLGTLLNELSGTALQLAKISLDLTTQLLRLQAEIHLEKKADNK